MTGLEWLLVSVWLLLPYFVSDAGFCFFFYRKTVSMRRKIAREKEKGLKHSEMQQNVVVVPEGAGGAAVSSAAEGAHDGPAHALVDTESVQAVGLFSVKSKSLDLSLDGGESDIDGTDGLQNDETKQKKSQEFGQMLRDGNVAEDMVMDDLVQEMDRNANGNATNIGIKDSESNVVNDFDDPMDGMVATVVMKQLNDQDGPERVRLEHVHVNHIGCKEHYDLDDGEVCIEHQNAAKKSEEFEQMLKDGNVAEEMVLEDVVQDMNDKGGTQTLGAPPTQPAEDAGEPQSDEMQEFETMG